MDLVTIASYSHQPEAHLAKNLLEAEGIQAFLSEELAADMLHLTNEVKLAVPAKDAEAARAILAAVERHELTKESTADAEAHADDSTAE